MGLLHVGDLEGEQAEGQAARGHAGLTGAATGGVSPVARAAAARASRLEGTIAPARVGRWLRVERLEGARWVTATDATVLRGGRYSVAVPGPGVYRVVYGQAVGPSVRVS